MKESDKIAYNVARIKDPEAFRIGVKILVRQIEREKSEKAANDHPHG